MFICFAEDIDLLPAQVSTDTILTPILKGNLRHGSIWQRLNELFLDINEGNEYKKISQYNGGIFKEDLDHLRIRDIVEDQKFFNDVYQNWKFEEYEKEINNNLGPYSQKVNPIYRNMLTISTFDFSTELDVNILGHIFENSIGDIEELKESSKGRRKKEGIFCTPEYITDYICENTIIPYLSKSGKINTIPDLVSEYWGSAITELDQKVKNIKVVDPACGSGAFLNKAADILLEIHKGIHEARYKDKKETLIPYFDNIGQRREILLNNIYGVDLNEESVDITKLSLFLKVCRKGLILPNLENNIKCGNSLIDDPEYTDKPFNWKKKFPEIFKEGGFDVIMGNPPWGVDFSENELKYLRKTNKDIIVRMIDSFMYFVYRFSLKMNGNGFFGMIVPDVILYQPNNLKLRKYLINNYSISRIINVGNNVFGDVTRPSSIVIFNALKNETKCIKSADFSKLSSDEIKIYIQDESSFESYDQELINDTPGNLFLTSYIDRYKILRKIKVNTSYTLADMVDSDKINRGVSPDLKESFIIKEDIIDEYNLEKSKLKKVLTGGKQVKRYYIDYQGHYLIYTTNKDHFEKIPNICNYIQQFKDRIKCKEVIQNKHSIYALHRPRKERIFTKKNKIVGVITSDKIIVTLDNDQYFTTDGLYLFSPIDKIDPLYLIGILNSKLFVFLYRLYSLEFGRVLAQVKPTIISQLPMYNVTLKEQQSIIEKASIMLQLNEQLQKEVEGFQYWLKHTFRFDNLSQKLKYYYELQLDEFFDELRKKKVDIMSRKNQELLRNEYEKSLSIIKPLLLEIKQTDNAINRMVYDLYGLTAEEIEIIEESLND